MFIIFFKKQNKMPSSFKAVILWSLIICLHLIIFQYVGLAVQERMLFSPQIICFCWEF